MNAFLLGLALSVLISPLASAGVDCTAIIGGTVYPVSAKPLTGGMVIIRGSTIHSVSAAGEPIPADCQTVDVTGGHVYPGLINGLTEVGIQELGSSVSSGDDTGEHLTPINSQLIVTDGFNTDSRHIPVTRKYGVTLVLTAPSEASVISGRSALVSLSGKQLDQIVVASPFGVHLNLGEPPKLNFGSRNQDPSTRLGVAQKIRQTLIQAQHYRAKKAVDPSLTEDGNMEALLPLLEGKIPALMRAQKYEDILVAIRIAEEFGLRMILVRGAEAWKARDELARRNIPVLLGPVVEMPTGPEKLGALYENPGLLHQAGVKFAIVTGTHNSAFRVSDHAGIAVGHNLQYGFDEEAALRSITLTAAEILGVADRYGSLDPGKNADVVISNLPILRPQARVQRLFIGGEAIDLDTWQEELREKYRKKQTQVLPLR